jgi:hypothetical protein
MTYRPDDRGSKHLWNVGKLLLEHTVQQPKRLITHRRQILKSHLVLKQIWNEYLLSVWTNEADLV